MTDWTSIASQVAGIGIKLLGGFLLSDPSSSSPTTYQQGDILWVRNGQKITAYNQGLTEHGMSFAKSQWAGTSPSHTALFLPMEGLANQDVTNVMSDFAEGHVCVGKVVDATSALKANQNTPATVSFAMPSLFLSTPVNIMGDIEGKVNLNQTSQVYELSLTTQSRVPIYTVAVRATNARGGAVNAQASYSTPSTSYKLAFPTGVDLSPLIENLSLTMTMDMASYVQATKQLRQNLSQGAFRVHAHP